MHTLTLTDEELDVLHDLLVAGIHKGFLRECTWTEDCASCALIRKITDTWIAWSDSDE